jgi:FlaA1/EpsC-like NDP-sugar epimerase
MKSIFQDKNILVTGGTGSIGSEIVRRILCYEPKVVRVYSNDEDGQFNLGQELQGYSNLRFLIGDVRDKERLKRAVESIDFIFHAAALKQVPLCEYNPFEAVKTNVLGAQNLIEVAIEENVGKMLTISTDKAVSPINVTKLLAERLTISANYYKGKRRTVFSCVRFGNVLDSRGSVMPLFREQLKKGGPLLVTDPDMTRFVMDIPQAAELMFKVAEMAQGGEIFVFKMPALRVGDLAEVMIEELAPQYGFRSEDIKLKITGGRPGEKNFEELMTQEEATSAHETEDMFILSPKMPEGAKKAAVKRYSSKGETLLSKYEIKTMLKQILLD